MEAVSTLWNQIYRYLSMVKFVDVLDIAIVTFLVYNVLNISRSKGSSRVIKAVGLLLLLSFFSAELGLNSLNFLVSKVIEIGLIALVVVFQPELRRLLERLGSSSLKTVFAPKVKTGDTIRAIDQTVAACRAMSKQKVGALIVFERENSMEEYFGTGTVIDAQTSAELLKNIFFPKAALHDGAVVMRNDRVAAAGCVLPLTQNPDLSRDLGTRHRAAIGVTENSDAIVIVVSEETGVISCAEGGMLKRYLTPETLHKLLRAELVQEEEAKPRQRINEYMKKFVGNREEDSDDKK